jgi:regulator of protease activity HflC (stomatin/prohibitin superfamily)
MNRLISILVTIGIIILLIIVFNLRIVPAGYVGVYHLFGKVQSTPRYPGLYVKHPLAHITLMDVRTQAYTMSITRGEGVKFYDDAIDALSKEGLKIRLDLTGWFHLKAEEAPRVFRTIGLGYVEKIVRPALRTAIRDVIANYPAQSIYSENRFEIAQKIEQKTASILKERGIVFEKLLLRNVLLPKKLEDAINFKLTADQEAQRMEFVLQKEQKEKERKIIEAQGIKEANQIIAQSLTPQYIKWYRIEMMKQLVDSPNNTIIFIPEELSVNPLVNVNK